MKKIIVLTLSALLVMAIAGNITWAYFSDSEASQNNTITAGTLDLWVGAEDPCTESMDTGPQLKPGDSGNAANWTATNTGSISGTLMIAVGSITNNENTRTEPEAAAGDITTGSTEGELGDFVDIAIWLDMNRSDGWDSGDMYLKSDGTVVNWASGSSVPPEAYDAINSYAGVDWESTDGMPTISGSGDLDFMVEYDFPTDANDDRAQGDSCVFDITFTLEQETS
jgi:predicted ribosomally synthesized peptide with SipW-like signal peptide